MARLPTKNTQIWSPQTQLDMARRSFKKSQQTWLETVPSSPYPVYLDSQWCKACTLNTTTLQVNCGHTFGSSITFNATTVPSVSWSESYLINMLCGCDMAHFAQMLIWYNDWPLTSSNLNISVVCREVNGYHYVLATGLCYVLVTWFHFCGRPMSGTDTVKYFSKSPLLFSVLHLKLWSEEPLKSCLLQHKWKMTHDYDEG